MKSIWIIAVVAVMGCAGGGVLAGPIDPNNPPEGRFSDEWVEIFMAGGKVGYGHSTMSRNGDQIHTALTMHLRIVRVDQKIEVGIDQHTTETLVGVPIEFGTDMDMAMMKMATNGTVKNGRVTIVTSQFGMEQAQSFDFPEGALMAWGLFRESLLRGFKTGTEYTLLAYAPELRLDGAISAETRIGAEEAFTHRGKTMKGKRVTSKMVSPIGEIEMVSWINEEGMPVKSTVPAPGLGDLIMIASDQETALKDFVAPEVFMTTTIKAKIPIDRRNVKQIRYRVASNDSKAVLTSFPSTGMQVVTTREDGTVEILSRRQHHRDRATDSAGETPPDIDVSEFLESNLMINTDDPKLIELAGSAADNEKDPYRLADNLRRFVGDYIHNKSLTVGFATASEVCRSKEGDCSEHGVLLAALGRINGLPSRVVVGLAYVPLFGRQQDIYGYHMWTQFYINGQWIDVDAALGETVCSPARIAFATSSLKNAGLADLSLPLISKIGSIDVDILEIDGKPVKRD